MKVLIINGSPRPEGNTATVLNEMAKTLSAEGVQSEIVTVGNRDIRGCVACEQCNSFIGVR